MPFTILFTSGSEGAPKGAVLSQGNIVAAMHAFRRAYRGREKLMSAIRIYNPVPISSNAAQCDVMCVPLMLGGTVVFDRELDVGRWIRKIESEKMNLGRLI